MLHWRPALGSYLLEVEPTERRILVTAIAACLFTGSLNARAQAPDVVRIAVDATAAGVPLKRVWAYHGFDEVNLSTSAPGRELLDVLGLLGSPPPHIRSHFLLNSGDGTPTLKWGSTNVYSEDPNGNPSFDWTLTDAILDAVTSSGNLPLVELGFMPHDLAAPPADPYRNSGLFTLDGHCFNPPKDFAKWAELIRAWATHVRDRYPNVENTWEWELWNEPDFLYWHGTPAEYLTLYDYTEAALHSVLPKAILGGPAVAGAGALLLRQLLEHCATGTNAVTGATGTRLNMVSFHAKGGVTLVDGHVRMDLGTQLRLHRIGFNAVGRFALFRQTPIVISEADPEGCAACAVADRPEDAYRNSPAYGAYVVAMMKRTLELEAVTGVNLRGLLTWAFLFNGMPYFAGYRTLSTNGIHLPVLNAFKLLGKLDGTRVPVTSSGSIPLDDILETGVRDLPDIDAIATRDVQRVSVLVWNYHDDLVTAPTTPIHLSISLPQGFGSRVSATHLRVDETHGDAYTVWVSQGRPTTPSREQIEALRQAMEPAKMEPNRVIDVVESTANLDFNLPRFGLSLITLTVAPDAEEPGIDASSQSSTSLTAFGGGCTCHSAHSNALLAPGAAALVVLGVAMLRRRRN